MRGDKPSTVTIKLKESLNSDDVLPGDSQPVMVRRGQRGSKKTHSNTHPIPSIVSQPFGSLGGSDDPNDSLKQRGIEACPQCHTLFNNPSCRPVREICGHIKCRTCFINNVDGCHQCRETEKPRKSGSGTVATASRRAQEHHHHDIDLMPPLLTVEEPISHRGYGSSSKGLTASAQLKELPPLLSSINSDSNLKSHLKRKQSTDDRVVAPLKIQKISSAKSRSSLPKEPDPVVRPSLGTRSSSRRSSVNSTSSGSSTRAEMKVTASSSSSRASSRYYRHDEQEDKRNSVMAKRGNGRKSATIVPVNQINMPSRLVSLRSTSKPGRLKQSSTTSLTSTSSKRKGSPQSSSSSTMQLTKSRLSYHTKDDDDSSFAVTISPTTLTKAPLASPSKSSSARGSNDLSVGFSRALSSSTTSSTLDLDLADSSSEGSDNSNSLDTCDSLFLKDDWSTSNSAEDKTDKPEIKKKKKRSPVTIHDHITILSGDQPLYQCNVCMKKFKTKAHIKYHEFCQNGVKPFTCAECGQGFIAKSHYEYHLRTHTGERPYVCPRCGKGFNQRGKVTRHMRSHTGEKPFICQQCGRGFANAQALRSHFLIHTGERPFACQYCNKRFTGMTNLKKHVITHTGERPFTCTHCQKSFGLKWTLDLHLRTHSTERPFACDQCSRAFSNSKDLRRHLVIHSGERPFKCWLCATTFRRKDNLDRHIKNTHNQPKEVAKKLANEAAADYMARSKSQGKHLIFGKCNQTIQGTSRGGGARSSKRVGKRISKQVEVVPAEQSPPTSPNPIGADDYVLPNGETDIPPGNLMSDTECVEPKMEVDTDTEEVVNEVESLAELRTVPMSEFHRSEGIKLLEMAKTNGGDSSDVDILKRQTDKGRGECTIENDEDVKPTIVMTDKDRDNSDGRNLTVTVLYEESGKCQFIPDEPTNSTQTVRRTSVNNGTARDGIEPKTEVDDMDCLELRTVPMSEFHRSQGIKLLEMAKTNGGDAAQTRNIEMNRLTVDGPSENDDEAENINLVLKVDRSPSVCNTVGSDVGDDYGQTDIPSCNTRTSVATKREMDTEIVLRNVPMDGYHKPEDVNKILRLGETNGESSDKENAAEINQLHKAESHMNNGACAKFHEEAENINNVVPGTVDRSSSTSPDSLGSSEIGDEYGLSNGQANVCRRGHHSSDSEFDDVGERRRVSIMNEYHEGIKMQALTTTNGESSDKENVERNRLANSECHIEGETGAKLHNGNEGSHSLSDAMTHELRSSKSQSRNFSFVASPPTSQSSVRFVYDNGEPISDDEEMCENSMRIVYACAAATAEPAVDEGGQQKVRLLYAEALGVGEPDDSGQVQLVYTSATPNQSLLRGPNEVQVSVTKLKEKQEISGSNNKIITTESNRNAEKIQRFLAHREDHSPVPQVEIQYSGNGTVMAQIVGGQPEDLSWIKRDLNGQLNNSCNSSSLIRGGTSSSSGGDCGEQQHHQRDKQSPSLLFAPNTQESTFSLARSDVTNHHNYAYPCTSSQNMRLSSTPNHTLYDGESDGLRTLAKAAETRRSTIEAEELAVTRAAAAIAAVGQEARNKRHQEMTDRGGTTPLPFMLKRVDPIPHQGPRKRYLSQLTDARK